MLQPTTDIDQLRWEHSRLRRNMLMGTWEWAVVTAMREQYSLLNVQNMGRPATSINLFANATLQSSILHDEEALITNPELGDAADEWALVAEQCHLRSILQELCHKVIGLREGFLFMVPTPTSIQLEVITPDEILVDKTTGDASKPTAIRRAMTFMVPKAVGGVPEPRDCWECWDVSDPSAPTHRVIDGENLDITSIVFPDETEYPFQDADGAFLPFAFYRAKYTSETFDPFVGSELVHGTLDVAVMNTMQGVIIRNCAYPQAYLFDGEVPGMSIADSPNSYVGAPPSTIDLAPNSIIRLKSTGQPGSGKIGQLAAVDAKTMGDAIQMRLAATLDNAGISPDDITSGGASQSGVAIQLKASAKRRIALTYVPIFRSQDEQALGLICRTHNLFYPDAPALPTTGWKVDYQLPAVSVSEVLDDLQADQILIAMGLKSLVDVAQKLYALDDPAAAVAKLQEIQRLNLMFPFTPPPAPFKGTK